MKRCLFVFICLMSLSSALFAAAERRVALVIGNNDYQNLPKLEKAVNDANSVAAELKKVGFEVSSFNNITQKKMNQAVNDFVQKIAGGGVGVFFYAGHGVQIDSQNFLIPVDMDSPRSDSDVADQAISREPSRPSRRFRSCRRVGCRCSWPTSCRTRSPHGPR